MGKILLGVICGLVFGVVSVLPMLRMSFPDRRAALVGAFINRFAIGFLIPNTSLPVDPVIIGGSLGLLLSLPDAIITKAYAPILGLGIVGGLLIGLAARLTGGG